MIIVPTAYFPSIEYMRALSGGGVLVEGCENFVKQTERNRCEIASDKGRGRLTVPIEWRHGEKMAIRDVRIDNREAWRRTHLRTLRTCYASAPYFDHYFPVVEELLAVEDRYLLEMNHRITERLMGLFRIEGGLVYTEDFEGARGLVVGEDYEYFQVFSERQPFIRGLSCLDYLFCEGWRLPR